VVLDECEGGGGPVEEGGVLGCFGEEGGESGLGILYSITGSASLQTMLVFFSFGHDIGFDAFLS